MILENNIYTITTKYGHLTGVHHCCSRYQNLSSNQTLKSQAFPKIFDYISEKQNTANNASWRLKKERKQVSNYFFFFTLFSQLVLFKGLLDISLCVRVSSARSCPVDWGAYLGLTHWQAKEESHSQSSNVPNYNKF